MGIASAREVVQRGRRFLTETVWAVRLNDLPRPKAFGYRVGRLAYASWRGLHDNDLPVRAAALTYYSVLSVVPFLAFAFAALKGFGAYHRLVEGALRPYLRSTFGENPALLGALEQVLAFVERTEVSSLGAFGVLFLIWASISLLSTVEAALNQIWGAKRPRPLVRRVTDYTTIMVVTPLLVLAAITFATAAQSSGVVAFLRDSLGLGPVIDASLKLTSLILGCGAMVALYILMPNARTKVRSALLGGLVGGTLWQLALFLHVQSQAGVARYSALYSGFAAIPIFLVWLYVSWSAVLVGGQLAATHQQEQSMRQLMRARQVDQALKEWLAIGVGAYVARSFLRDDDPIREEELVDALELPVPAIDEVLEALVKRRVLARALTGSAVGYVPGRDIDSIRLSDLAEAMRQEADAAEMRTAMREALGPELTRTIESRQECLERGAENPTMRQLAAMIGDRARRGGAVAPEAPERLDAKQPGLSS